MSHDQMKSLIWISEKTHTLNNNDDDEEVNHFQKIIFLENYVFAWNRWQNNEPVPQYTMAK